MRLNASHKSNEDPRAPRFLKRMSKTIVKPAGNTLTLRCRADGNPTPNVTWLKDNKKPERSLGKIRQNQWAITLDDLIISDAGNYTCIVSNIWGSINFTYVVDVVGK